MDVLIEGDKPPFRVLYNGLDMYELLFRKKEDLKTVAPRSH